jgi:DNA-binding MarR family transcriptional regulator
LKVIGVKAKQSRRKKVSNTISKSTRLLGDADYRQLADFRYAIRVFLEFSEQAARGAGLTPQQHQALLAIRGMSNKTGASVSMIAERLRIRHHSAVELVNRLAAAKLVIRTQDVNDQRRVLVTLMPKAEMILQSLSTTHVAELRKLKSTLNSVTALRNSDNRASARLFAFSG